MRKKLTLAGIGIVGLLMIGNNQIQPKSIDYVKKQSDSISAPEDSYFKINQKEVENKLENQLNILDKKRVLELLMEKVIGSPLIYKVSDFNEDPDQVLLARMLLGEAEDCSKIEKIAVAYTAINRAKDNKKWNGKNLKEVILKPYQYSCFNKEYNQSLKDPMRYNEKEFISCLNLAEEILNGKYKDPTGGATYYYNPSKIKKPNWAKKLKRIGRIKNSYHVFYKET